MAFPSFICPCPRRKGQRHGKLILIIFQSKLKHQKATRCYSPRVPGRQQRQNLHLLFISVGSGEGAGGPVRPAFVQLSGPGLLPCWPWNVVPRCNRGTFSIREWTAEVQLRFSFSFLALSPQSPPWPDSERPEKQWSRCWQGCCAAQPSGRVPVLSGHKG